MALPYATATAGSKAFDDLRKTLQAFGCDRIASMEDFGGGTVAVQFVYRGRQVQATASWKGYASRLLSREGQADRKKGKQKPWTEAQAVAQGQLAVWSILRDWIRGQITAIECGILTFDSAFLGQILLPDGRTIHERVAASDMLPALEAPKP